ncbi:MAG TPA: RNase adapter RapZ [Pyrinomonadaceae bacterium]|nr:RNase adapter RapZ [Pyrinomonadaceae bacterium]
MMTASNQEQRDGQPAPPNIVIITGLSGSGMSSATNAFEDLGYFCVDNLPVTLLPTFARLVRGDDQEGGSEKSPIERAALVINIREGHFLGELEGRLKTLRNDQKLRVYVLFLEAANDVLARRFSETRRPHPADNGAGLLESIISERQQMKEIRALADHVIDTSEHTVHTLRRYLVERFSPHEDGSPMQVQVVSFGHKYGSPREMDLLFDVRHLPNPHFVPELRPFSGHDKRVVDYLKSHAEVEETLRRFSDLLEYLLPLYQGEGKSYVTVGIGCTGGRHRSVMIANSLARNLRRAGYKTVATHRDTQKAARRKKADGKKPETS